MPVISMVSAGAPEVEINLPAAEYIRRNRFNRYHCTFDIYPGETYPLQLISVTPKANANQLYTMRLQLIPGKQAVPSPGMNAMVTIFAIQIAPVRYPSLPVPSCRKTESRMSLSTMHQTIPYTIVKYLY